MGGGAGSVQRTTLLEIPQLNKRGRKKGRGGREENAWPLLKSPIDHWQ